ncbi:TatD family hydrolase [Bacteroides sp. 51]|uniref:TatD family hydrolase n=1 Tax=Bacteroides sp. 51 TaxID=2302938 RepID=UPI0013D09B50|nr:TatD family hydrolase [Bacteroides sp. 51]NDV80691.1 TatD family deoxyribonuclease [Bacteroides sp. 51]
MELLDIHTHHLSTEPGQAIQNVFPADFAPRPNQYYSVGYHPWYLSKDGSEDWQLLNEIIANPQVLAVGEAGLDKVTEVDYSIQHIAFERQVAMAIQVHKPLVIHCVRSYNEVVELKKALKPTNPWIIHGFRGKKELAKQLTDHGIYLSYGFKFQEEALRTTPLNMLFLETDESDLDIHLLYQQVADHLSLSVSELTERVQENISNVFFSNKSCLFK